MECFTSNDTREESRESGGPTAFLAGNRTGSTGIEAVPTDAAGARKRHIDDEGGPVAKCKRCKTKIAAGQPIHKCCNCGGNVCDACKDDDFNTCEGCDRVYCNSGSDSDCYCGKCQLCGLIKCFKTCFVVVKGVDRCVDADSCLDEDEIEDGGWDKLTKVRVDVSNGCCVCRIDYPGFGEFFWDVEGKAPLCENCAVSSQEYDDKGAEMHRHVRTICDDGCSVCGSDYVKTGVFFWNEKTEAPMCENCAQAARKSCA